MNYELKVVEVTNNPGEYPEFARASAEYPQLVDRLVEDESATFVVDPETGDFWPIAEFFHVCAITAFLVDQAELSPGVIGPDMEGLCIAAYERGERTTLRQEIDELRSSSPSPTGEA